MGTDHRVLGVRICRIELRDFLIGCPSLAQTSAESCEVVSRHLTIYSILDALRETVIRRVHVGEECVAASSGSFEQPQDRTERRVGSPGDVGVPKVLEAGRVLVVRDREHFGETRLFRCERMDFQLAEAAAERKVLLGGDVLVVKEEHFPVKERLADDADRCVAERGVQVDTAHHGADRR